MVTGPVKPGPADLLGSEALRAPGAPACAPETTQTQASTACPEVSWTAGSQHMSLLFSR